MDDRRRFEALYRTHAQAVAAYVRRRSDAQTADDVVADVFVVAWRRLGDVPDDALPWLLGVARRTLANHRRGLARGQALRDRIRFERSDAFVRAGRGDHDDAVLLALGALREPDREALLLVGWEGLEPAQAARALGVRTNTFAARFSRARRRFAQALDAQAPPHDTHPRSVRGEVVP